MFTALLFSFASLLPVAGCSEFAMPTAVRAENNYTFNMRAACQFTEFKLAIYDSYGNRKFETQDPQFELNMQQYQSKGAKVFTPGNYFYMIEARVQETNKIFSYSGYFAFVDN